MADAAVAPLKPKWQLILGLLPSLNTCFIAIVTAGVTLGGTLATQHLVAPKAASGPMVIPAAAVPDLANRLSRIEGDVSLVADWVAAQKPKIPARPLAPKK